MKIYPKRWMKLLFFLSLISATFACRSHSEEGSNVLDKLPFYSGDVEPKLGDGYDSLIQELRNTPNCVVGNTSKLTSHSSSINLHQSVDSKDLMREFSGEVQGTPRMVFLQTGVGAGFFRSLAQKQSALNIVYAVKITAGGEKLGEVQLLPEIKSLTSLEQFRRCGDSYVMQINRGGILAINLSFDFGTDENKSKWQTKFKLGGALGELSKDLTQKIKQEGIDGSLTIHVTQTGGTANQPILNVRSCNLSTSEDFAVCKNQLDELIKYASEKFPGEVQSQPAILNYVTASLQTLGVGNLPSIDQSVLNARRELEELQRVNNLHIKMMEKAQSVGLGFEEQLIAKINANKHAVLLGASKCYKYTFLDSRVSWGACLSEFNQIKDKIHKFAPEALALNEIHVRANSPVGGSIVNGYSTKMKVVYKVASKGTLSNPCKSAKRDASILSPRDQIGAILVRSDNNYQTALPIGTSDIYPGESLGFVYNDSLGGYRDNLGSQTIYWRCLDCTTNQEKLPTYRLIVKADAENGAIFRSRLSGLTNYRFVSYGRWRSSPRASWSGPLGGRESCTSNCPVPSAAKQSLIFKSSGNVKVVGADGCIKVGQNDPGLFLMNDEKGRYGDNQGEIEIILQEKKCDVRSYPLKTSTSTTSAE